jgi:hypothetical protein
MQNVIAQCGRNPTVLVAAPLETQPYVALRSVRQLTEQRRDDPE